MIRMHPHTDDMERRAAQVRDVAWREVAFTNPSGPDRPWRIVQDVASSKCRCHPHCMEAAAQAVCCSTAGRADERKRSSLAAAHVSQSIATAAAAPGRVPLSSPLPPLPLL